MTFQIDSEKFFLSRKEKNLQWLIVFHPMQEILKELQAFITEKRSSKVTNSSTAENNKSHDATVSETLEDPPIKKAKLEPIETAAGVVGWRTEELHVCVVCLGILQGLCEAEHAVKVCVLVQI